MAHTYTERQLREDFEVVAEHYELRRLGEYKLAERLVRDDIESAMVCYRSLANEIRGVE